VRIVVALDSFKGSLTAVQACDIVATAIRSVLPSAEVVTKPMADGGEGTAAVLMAVAGGQWVRRMGMGPLPEMQVEAGFVWLPESRTALVEMATASGLPLLRADQRNPLKTTTYGTGELIRAAIEHGAHHILLAIGGSATVDGGIGAAMALGWRFLAEDGGEIGLGGGQLTRITTIVPPAGSVPVRASRSTGILPVSGTPNAIDRVWEPSSMGVSPMNVQGRQGQDAPGTHGRDGRATHGRDGDPKRDSSRLGTHAHATTTPCGVTTNVAVEVLCDVDNPLCGEHGAARVFGPQKGATPEIVEQLEEGLVHLARLIKDQLGQDIACLPGAGAAGGLAAGAVAFMDGRLVSGVEAVMAQIGLPEAVAVADWVVTGEGSFDAQSLHGKVVSGVTRVARAAGAKVAVCAGQIWLEPSVYRQAGIEIAAACMDAGMELDYAIAHSAELLTCAARRFARAVCNEKETGL
jgi:glycerate kinase